MNNEFVANSFRSNAGHNVHVRPLQDDDAPLLIEIFEHMTSESRYMRYHQTLDHVLPSRVQQEAINIVQADPHTHWGLIALADVSDRNNVPIGAARFVRTGPHEAEVAISIRDDFQSMGIGSKLMHMLAETARRLELHSLVADIQNSNTAIWRIFRSLPYEVSIEPEGTSSRIVISLTSPLELARSISSE